MTLLRVSRRAMGTEFQIVLAGGDERHLERAASYALDEVERLDRQMSLYNPQSDLCWVNAHAGEGPAPVEPGLFAVLQCAAEVNAATDGAFDVTVGPLVRCWGFFRGQGAIPPEEKIAEALEHVGMRHVILEARGRTVRFGLPGLEIDLGGIAKGYAVDRAVTLLRESGVTSALVHGGYSTVYGLGCSPEGEAWPVGVRHPRDPARSVGTVGLRDRALSTSGNYERFFTFEGVVYSHILDPRTGWPAQGMLSASAVTETAMEGDALSTAFFANGVARAQAYCERHPSMGAVLVPQPTAGREPEAIVVGAI